MLRNILLRLTVIVCLLSVLTCQTLAVSTSAQSVILIEQESGRVIYESGADEERLIASITKIMTALVALEYGDLNAQYTVTAEDMAEGSSMYLVVGEELTLETLLYGLMLSSGNDAALAVAHCVSGEMERFVDLMNDTAVALEMHHSHFANPNGLDQEGHYSTARDMAKLAAYAMRNETFRRIVSTVSVTIGNRFFQNHNKLLQICEGCIGIKTGFTKAAGRTLVSAVQRNGMTLICVTLKDGDDWNDHMALYEFGYKNFQMTTLINTGQKLAQIRLTDADSPAIFAVASGDLSYPVMDGESLTLKVVVPVSVSAPVMPGQVLGTAIACLNGEEVSSVDIVAMQGSERMEMKEHKGFFERLFNK